MTFKRSIPEIDLVQDPIVRDALEAIKEILEVREGQRGDVLDKGVIQSSLVLVNQEIAIKTDTFSGTAGGSTSVATGLKVTITPTSDVALIVFSGNATLGVNNALSAGLRWKIVRLEDNKDVFVGNAAGSRTKTTGHAAFTNSAHAQDVPLYGIDTPGTTKPRNYEIFLSAFASTNVYLNRAHTDTDAVGFARHASILIASEYKFKALQNR